MKEIRNRLIRCWEESRRVVLATIVQVRGSAYRREGARCLIYETGEVYGIISGGCVEADLAEHAREVLRTNLPQKVDYDFRWQNDEIWGLGLGCNGAITIWLQPFDPVQGRDEAETLLQEFDYRMVCDDPYTFTMVVESSDGQALRPGKHWRSSRTPHAEEVAKDNLSGLREDEIEGIQATLFVEQVTPRPRLAIYGSGPDAALLAKQARELDYRISVVDHREALLQAHFAEDEHIVIRRGDYAAWAIHPGSFAVVMTHNLDFDQMAVLSLLPSNIAYLGVLGSHERIDKILTSIRASAAPIDEKWLEKLFCPIGLDVGAKTPEEITLSILAEITAVKNGRSGKSMRNLQQLSAMIKNGEE